MQKLGALLGLKRPVFTTHTNDFTKFGRKLVRPDWTLGQIGRTLGPIGRKLGRTGWTLGAFVGLQRPLWPEIVEKKVS